MDVWPRDSGGVSRALRGHRQITLEISFSEFAQEIDFNLRRKRVKQIIATDRGPKAIGPYSQAVKANGFLFVSGQICLDPKTQQLIEGDVSKQTERVMENLKGIVEAAGSSLDHVVKTTVFLSDMNDFAA